jgi:hypothetical protein
MINPARDAAFDLIPVAISIAKQPRRQAMYLNAALANVSRAEWNHALAAQRCLYWILARGSSASFRSPAPRLWSTAALRNVPSRVEVGRLPPSREFEHPPLPSVINPKISASVNHRVSPSFRPRLGARSLIARRVTLKRSATLISNDRGLADLGRHHKREIQSREIAQVIWGCFLYPVKWRHSNPKAALGPRKPLVLRNSFESVCSGIGACCGIRSTSAPPAMRPTTCSYF